MRAAGRALLVLVLVSGCSSTRYGTRRPLSQCARNLVSEGRFPESETAKAVDYCTAKERAPAVAVAAPSVAAEPELERPIATPVEAAPTAPPTDVLMVAAAHDDLSTFVRLLDVAGLTAEIQNAQAVTLFAPTNQALAKFPHLAANKERLKKVLSRHIVLETVSTTDAPAAPLPPRRLKPLAGQPLPMRAGRDGVVAIGRAKVVRGDVSATQGNVDVIDAVLMP